GTEKPDALTVCASIIASAATTTRASASGSAAGIPDSSADARAMNGVGGCGREHPGTFRLMPAKPPAAQLRDCGSPRAGAGGASGVSLTLSRCSIPRRRARHERPAFSSPLWPTAGRGGPARAARIEDELARRGVKLKGKTNRYGPCPRCGGTDRFAINTRKGLWNCRGCKSKNIKGDVIGLVQFLDGCGFGEAIKRLISSPMERTASPEQPSKTKSTDVAEQEQRRVARWLWSQRRPATGSLVETYLRARGYTG